MKAPRPPKELNEILRLIDQLPKRYKAAFVAADSEDREGGLFVAFSCCRSCAIHAMELAQVGLIVEIEMEKEKEQHQQWVQ